MTPNPSKAPRRLPARLGLAFALLLPACGSGGGGGDDPGQSATPGPTPTASVRTEAILEACALEGVRAFETVAADFDGAIDGEGTAPDFRVTGIDLLGAALDWTLDADVDGQVDLAGTVAFLDAGGSPTWPFTPDTVLALLAGTADLATLLGTIPDGTTVVVTYATLTSPVPVTGSLEVGFAGGEPAVVSGEADLAGLDCPTTVSFEDLSAADLLDPAPSGTFALLVTTDGGTLEGTLTLHGDGTATIDVVLDGTDRTVWDYDLATRTLTRRP
jgi:hypothetical protein